MKKIFIVRHAKSSWADLSMKDIDRPLNKRGKNDAPIMAGHCKKIGIIPDVMVSSNANRAMLTAEAFRACYGKDKVKFQIEPNLYHAPESTYIEVCFGLDEDDSSVMMFGHNPGITYLANSVTDKYIDNVPTCGVLVIESSADQWTDVDFSNCKLIDFLYPKML